MGSFSPHLAHPLFRPLSGPLGSYFGVYPLERTSALLRRVSKDSRYLYQGQDKDKGLCWGRLSKENRSLGILFPGMQLLPAVPYWWWC